MSGVKIRPEEFSKAMMNAMAEYGVSLTVVLDHIFAVIVAKKHSEAVFRVQFCVCGCKELIL